MKLYVRSTKIYGDRDSYDSKDYKELILSDVQRAGFNIQPDDIEIRVSGKNISIYFVTTIRDALKLSNRYDFNEYFQYVDEYIRESGFDPDDLVRYRFDKRNLNEYINIYSKGLPSHPYMDYFDYVNRPMNGGEGREIYKCILNFEDYVKRQKGNNKKPTYRSIMSKLQSEVDTGINSIYEQTESGEYVDSIAQSVEDSLGIWSEPSIQAGHGSIIFRDKSTDDILLEKDYEEYCDDIIDMALQSKSKKGFVSQLKQYYDI